MSVKDGLSKRVMFNVVDNLEQKIDRLTVMMGKVVTEDEGQSKPFKPQVYQPNRGRNQKRGNYHVGLGIIMPTGVVLHTTRILGAEQEIALIIEETTGITCEVIKDIEIIIIITEEMVIEVKIMTGTEVGH